MQILCFNHLRQDGVTPAHGLRRVFFRACYHLRITSPADYLADMTLHIPKSLMRPVGRAIQEYKMITAGDRILLGLSGGKDLLTLLHVLLALARYAPV